MVDFAKVAERIKDKSARLARHEYVTIVAGSRGLNGMGDLELVSLAAKRSGFTVTKVISGTAKGIDQAGEKWAAIKGIPVEQMPADWAGEGKSAGYKRNERMAQRAEALIAVWDGKSKGTGHMIDIARRYGLEVFVLYVSRWWVTGRFPSNRGVFTCMVVTDPDGNILWTADLLKTFLTQDIFALIKWGRCEVEAI